MHIITSTGVDSSGNGITFIEKNSGGWTVAWKLNKKKVEKIS